MKRVTPTIRLVANTDGSYDIWVEYRAEAEFAEEFLGKREETGDSRRVSKRILDYAKKARIRSIKILVSGALVASMAFSAFLTAFAGADRYIMGYLYTGNDHQRWNSSIRPMALWIPFPPVTSISGRMVVSN